MFKEKFPCVKTGFSRSLKNMIEMALGGDPAEAKDIGDQKRGARS
jgi:hypothetical protein